MGDLIRQTISKYKGNGPRVETIDHRKHDMDAAMHDMIDTIHISDDWSDPLLFPETALIAKYTDIDKGQGKPAFNEKDHKRDDGGQFTGVSGEVTDKKAAAHSLHLFNGGKTTTPADVKKAQQRINVYRKRKGLKPIAEDGKLGKVTLANLKFIRAALVNNNKAAAQKKAKSTPNTRDKKPKTKKAKKRTLSWSDAARRDSGK